jgi:hypothetical protein
VEVILPQAIDTFGNHRNGIQVLGQGQNDVFNWVNPSYSWGLFVFACPSQQGTGANCNGSVTTPGLNSVPIIVRQKNSQTGRDDVVGVVLSLFARPRPGTGNPQIASAPPILQNIGQPEQRDASGRVQLEAAVIHIVTCNARQVYIYEYQNRVGFRAISPPDFGHALGGKDFTTYLDAVKAGCG